MNQTIPEILLSKNQRICIEKFTVTIIDNRTGKIKTVDFYADKIQLQDNYLYIENCYARMGYGIIEITPIKMVVVDASKEMLFNHIKSGVYGPATIHNLN